MRTTRRLVGLFLCSAGVLVASAARGRAQALDKTAIDRILTDALEAWKVPGASLAVVYRGQVYVKGYGVKQLGNPRRVTPDTLFPLASCTKAFTTTAMAMLVDEGKMAWDDPVRKHLPAFRLSDPLANAQVTLRDLVSHRTGLAGHDLLWYRSPWSQEEIIRRAGRLPLSKPFRSGYQYQSIMVMAAGQAVARAAGCPWQEYVQKRVFDPLGMKGACFTTTAALKAPDHASPHRQNKQGKVEVIPWFPMAVPDPAGSINAGARDLSRWLQFQLSDGTFGSKRLVSAENLEETHQAQTIMRLDPAARAMQPHTVQMCYGMGWVIQDYRGQQLVSHGGAIDGFRAHITLAPQARLGIVLLNNLEGTQMNLAVSNNLVDLILDLKTQDWNTDLAAAVEKEKAAHAAAVRRWLAKRRPGTKPSMPLARYAGTYEDPAYGTVRIANTKGALLWEWSTFRGPLEHFHYDTFTAQQDFLGNPPVVFTINAAGQVSGLRFLNVDFKRAKQ
jgi:CubicO group peptidase (beta-lactamase class C family)